MFGGRGAGTWVQSFDPAQGIWQAHSPMPVGRSHHAVAAVEGRVVVLGGLGSDEIDDPTAEPWSRVDVYDPAGDTWSAAPDAPFARFALAAAARDGLVFVLGGRDAAGAVTDEVWVLDPDLGWAMGPALPRARAGHAAALLEGSLVVAGGVGADAALLADVDALTWP